LYRYRIEQRRRTRSGKRDAMLADDPPHDEHIAMIRSHQGLASVIEIPKWRCPLVEVPQRRRREIGSLQMLRPFRRQRKDPPVDCLECVDLTVGQLVRYDDDEIDVTVSIKISNGE